MTLLNIIGVITIGLILLVLGFFGALMFIVYIAGSCNSVRYDITIKEGIDKFIEQCQEILDDLEQREANLKKDRSKNDYII